MTNQEWHALLGRVSFRPSLPAIKFRLSGSTIFARHDVPCNESGQRGIFHARELPPVVSEEHAVAWLRSFVRDIYKHEIDEALLVDGKQLADPHCDVSGPCPAHQACVVRTVASDNHQPMYSCTTDASERPWPRVLWTPENRTA